MGKVFTWEEIRDGRIPQPRAFNEIASLIRSELGNCDAILGAVLCGSLVHGTHNLRSDADCVIVYDVTRRAEAIILLQQLRAEAKARHVPVELIPLDVQIARTAMHHIAPSFAEHLSRAAARGGVIKRNPLEFIELGHITAQEDFRNYLRAKIRGIEKGLTHLDSSDDEKVCLVLQKALEVPVHIARKLLRLEGSSLQDDSKASIVGLYPDIASPAELGLFHGVLAADAAYTRELVAQTQQPNEHRYVAHLATLKLSVPEALDFVRLSALRIA